MKKKILIWRFYTFGSQALIRYRQSVVVVSNINRLVGITQVFYRQNENFRNLRRRWKKKSKNSGFSNLSFSLDVDKICFSSSSLSDFLIIHCLDLLCCCCEWKSLKNLFKTKTLNKNNLHAHTQQHLCWWRTERHRQHLHLLIQLFVQSLLLKSICHCNLFFRIVITDHNHRDFAALIDKELITDGASLIAGVTNMNCVMWPQPRWGELFRFPRNFALNQINPSIPHQLDQFNYSRVGLEVVNIALHPAEVSRGSLCVLLLPWGHCDHCFCHDVVGSMFCFLPRCN